jgi:PAS domain-containing protein
MMKYETPIQIFWMITDITDQKTAEQVISKSEEKYRTLVEQASDAIFLFDHD